MRFKGERRNLRHDQRSLGLLQERPELSPRAQNRAAPRRRCGQERELPAQHRAGRTGPRARAKREGPQGCRPLARYERRGDLQNAADAFSHRSRLGRGNAAPGTAVFSYVRIAGGTPDHTRPEQRRDQSLFPRRSGDGAFGCAETGGGKTNMFPVKVSWLYRADRVGVNRWPATAATVPLFLDGWRRGGSFSTWRNRAHAFGYYASGPDGSQESAFPHDDSCNAVYLDGHAERTPFGEGLWDPAFSDPQWDARQGPEPYYANGAWIKAF